MEEKKLLSKLKQHQETGNKFQQAEVCRNLGYYYDEKLLHDEALEYFENAALLYRKLEKNMQYAQVNRMIGEIYINNGDYDKALHYQKIYLDIAKKENNNVELQRALTSVGRTYLTKAIYDPSRIEKGGLKLALESFQESLRMCDILKNISKYEKADMKGRAYLNIGVIYEHLNEFEESFKNMTKAIHIWKVYENYDQLCTGYRSMGFLFAKQNDHSTAIAKYNEAIENAKRVSNKTEQICSNLIHIADSYIRICNYTRAKYALLKAYRMNTPNNCERHLIKGNLKIVIVLCNSEKNLLDLHEDNFFERKVVYEKMGDAAVSLKSIETAIEYYKKVLKYAQAAGETEIQLAKIYMSLAQSYNDLKKYDLALEYYRKELECAKNHPEESYLPLLNIAIVFDLMGKPFEEVVAAFKKARQTANTTNDTSYLGKVLRSERLTYQKNKNTAEFEKCNNELKKMNCMNSDSESEDVDQSIGDDINLDDLSELSDDEFRTNTSPGNSRPVRNRKKRKATINTKGETQLHLACINGDYKLVKFLIDQGCDINARDYSNWLPIHEACNYGNLKVIELLVQYGAHINDGGFKGITPLHDACGNGHLETVKFLMDNGAHLVARTDKGLTPLSYLEDWYKINQPLERDDQELYKLIVSKLRDAVERVGEQIVNRQETSKSRENSALMSQEYQIIGNLRHVVDKNDDLNYVKPTCSRVSNINHRLDRSMQNSSSDSSSSNDESEKQQKEVGSGKEYKQIMEQLRRRRPEENVRNSKNGSIDTIDDPLVDEDDLGDDWLEDDLGRNAGKKRKRDSGIINLLTTNNVRNADVPATDISVNLIMDVDDEQENVDPARREHNIHNNKRRKSQVSLLDSGFSRRRSDSPTQFKKLFINSVTLVDKIIPKSIQRQPKLNSFVDTFVANEPECTISSDIKPAFTLNQTVPPIIRRPLLPVNVKINNTLWKIPVPAENLEQLTIGWLATEAAKRYYKKEGIRPTLQLYAKDGAILENDDPLSLIFMDDISDVIECTIVSWDLPDIHERYKEACENSKTEMHLDIYQSLVDCNTTTRLIIDDIMIKREQYEPLFRTLKHQVDLRYLVFLYTTLLPDAFKQLCLCLPHLLQLKYLNFTMNNLTNESLKCFSDTFVTANKPILEKLTDLDLSHNLLNNDCLSTLSTILRYLRLKSLNIGGNCFTANIFDCGSTIEFNFECLETLDLSENHFNQIDITYFIKQLNFNIVTSFNCSHNNVVGDNQIILEIVKGIQQASGCKLKTLDLARCHVTDSDVWELLRLLKNVHTLETINLAYNNQLTSVTLRRILQHSPSFSTVSFEACWNVITYLMECETLEVPENCNLKSLTISIDFQANHKEMAVLTKLWERIWKSKSVIETKLRNFVHFTAMD